MVSSWYMRKKRRRSGHTWGTGKHFLKSVIRPFVPAGYRHLVDPIVEAGSLVARNYPVYKQPRSLPQNNQALVVHGAPVENPYTAMPKYHLRGSYPQMHQVAGISEGLGGNQYWGKKVKHRKHRHPNFAPFYPKWHPIKLFKAITAGVSPKMFCREIYKSIEEAGAQLVTAGANLQGVYSSRNFTGYFSQTWITALRNKYGADLLRSNGSIVTGVNPAESVLDDSALTIGTIPPIEITNFSRTYMFQNPTTVPVVLKILRYKDKMDKGASTNGGHLPQTHWATDLARDGMLSTSSAPTVFEEGVTTRGKYPNKYCTELNRQFYLVAYDKLLIPPGATVRHTVKLPNVTLSGHKFNDVDAALVGDGSTAIGVEYHEHLSQVDMFILCSACFGWAETTGDLNDTNMIVNPACGINFNWEQTYTVRGVPSYKNWAQATFNNLQGSDTNNYIDGSLVTDADVQFLQSTQFAESAGVNHDTDGA